MSADPYIGALLCFPFQRSITNFAVCQGQTVTVSQYQALFAVIGTIYGGNGATEFQLPDLRGRVPVGRAASGTFATMGLAAGAGSVSLTPAQMPAHSHPVAVAANGATLAFNAAATVGKTNIPSNTVTISEASVKVGIGNKAVNFYAPAGAASAGHIPAALFGTSILQATGGNAAFLPAQPTMALNYQIATQGLFPTAS
jgi:microcystin-dependent protein